VSEEDESDLFCPSEAPGLQGFCPTRTRWVTARERNRLVGFVNVILDGDVHAWIQDVMVSTTSRNKGVGTQLVAVAREASRESGCEWLHVDCAEGLGKFYFDACRFEPATAGLIQLRLQAVEQVVSSCPVAITISTLGFATRRLLTSTLRHQPRATITARVSSAGR